MTPAGPVDPITLAVVAGAYSAAVAEMSAVIERTARSPIVALSHDFSNAIYTTVDGAPQMVVQGQDQPCHLGGMLSSVRNIAERFAGDLAPGDVIISNDPVLDGTHLLDIDLVRPIFVDGAIVGWSCSRAHAADLGGPVGGSYNPEATDAYGECLMIPPTKLARGDVLREDVLGIILANVRTAEALRGDLGAQLSACRVADRRVVALCARYGTGVVLAAGRQLLDRSERQMRAQIAAIPDGVYAGEQWIQDDGRGGGAARIGATVEVAGERLSIAIDSPPQLDSYRNSYWGLTVGAALFAVIGAVEPGVTINEGLYRPVEVIAPPEGTMLNPRWPAAAQMSTADVWANVFDAVCDALSQAVPERAAAGWERVALFGVSGVDPRTGAYYGGPLMAAIMGGSGSVAGHDGGGLWGVVSTGGGSSSGDVELIEARQPLRFHRHELAPDSGCPGRWRGALGAVVDFEVVGHRAQLAHVGDGTLYPAASRLGGGSPEDAERRVHRKLLVRADGTEEPIPLHAVRTAHGGDRVICHLPGGGAIGPATDRDPALVARDVAFGYVTPEGARRDYGWDGGAAAAAAQPASQGAAGAV
jgi:N-methylhydantoinase B